MKQFNISMLLLLLLAAPLAAEACTAPPRSLTRHLHELVAGTSQIVLARALPPRTVAGQQLPAFETIEVVKGEVSEEFVLENSDLLDASFWATYGYPAGRDTDFNGHRHIAVWHRGLTRGINDTDCKMRPGFEPGETYLLFLDHPHWAAYELVRRKDDLWLQAVRNLVADPSRRFGVSVTVPQWLAMAPRIFVFRVINCETPDIEMLDVLSGDPEVPFPEYRLLRPMRNYRTRAGCTSGMSFLTVVYYQGNYGTDPLRGAKEDYTVSANFDVIDGKVDFSRALDDYVSKFEVIGPRVWSLDDLKQEVTKFHSR